MAFFSFQTEFFIGRRSITVFFYNNSFAENRTKSWILRLSVEYGTTEVYWWSFDLKNTVLPRATYLVSIGNKINSLQFRAFCYRWRQRPTSCHWKRSYLPMTTLKPYPADNHNKVTEDTRFQAVTSISKKKREHCLEWVRHISGQRKAQLWNKTISIETWFFS